MKIIDKIQEARDADRNFYSFEYFPPKTEIGVANLYDRIDRMAELSPSFIDVTWGAGGSTAGLTIDIATKAQNLSGVETMIHMTCTNMPVSDIRNAVQKARDNGIQNILALRGDPPQGTQTWAKVEGGLEHAIDLVRLVRKEHGDYFGITVAGYPEGHPDLQDYLNDLKYLKDKADAGADVVITQLFYDCDVFLKFEKDCREMGITCPILPGIMPIQTYAGWKRMISFCRTKVPQAVVDALEPIKDDDEEVQAFGVKLGVTMCKYLLQNGIRGLHFYTLNLEKSVTAILQGLELVPDSIHRTLPWKVSANAKRQFKEDVRPIFWANRPKSYLARTMSWDAFPNGRWGDSRSPAFGELEDYHLIGLHATKQGESEKRKMWGEELACMNDVHKVFIKYLHGQISAIPWYDKHLEKETSFIMQRLIDLNRRGFMTINSQPKVNGAHSDDRSFGWGGKGGYVYQKAYIEFFTSPERTHELIAMLNKNTRFSYNAININGDFLSNTGQRVNAVTWGVFPGKEIVQPTVVDPESFKVWKNEAFGLWKSQWLPLYGADTASAALINNIYSSFFLISIVDNDFVSGDIFDLFMKFPVICEDTC